MRTGLIARKVGMSRLFRDDGTHVPVTLLHVDACQVVAHRTLERDGYVALQLGAGAVKPKRLSKAVRGHYAKAEVEPKRMLAEFRIEDGAVLAACLRMLDVIEDLDDVRSVTSNLEADEALMEAALPG